MASYCVLPADGKAHDRSNDNSTSGIASHLSTKHEGHWIAQLASGNREHERFFLVLNLGGRPWCSRIDSIHRRESPSRESYLRKKAAEGEQHEGWTNSHRIPSRGVSGIKHHYGGTK